MKSGLSKCFRAVGLEIACRSHGEWNLQHSSVRDLTFPTKVPSDSLGWIGSLKRTSDKSLFPMALGSCGHRITHQLRPINMNGRSILAVTSDLGLPSPGSTDTRQNEIRQQLAQSKSCRLGERIMPATLQVREVHDALYLAGGGSASAGNGAPSTVLLGRLFHEVFADLIGSDPQKNLKTALIEGDLEGDAQRRSVLQHVYDRLVGPRLRCHQANLHCSSPQVLTFWQAITALCDWLMETPEKAANIAPVDPLTLELRDPGWTDSVFLTGIPDAPCASPTRTRGVSLS